jgi:hypothetical protein
MMTLMCVMQSHEFYAQLAMPSLSTGLAATFWNLWLTVSRSVWCWTCVCQCSMALEFKESFHAVITTSPSY